MISLSVSGRFFSHAIADGLERVIFDFDVIVPGITSIMAWSRDLGAECCLCSCGGETFPTETMKEIDFSVGQHLLSIEWVPRRFVDAEAAALDDVISFLDVEGQDNPRIGAVSKTALTLQLAVRNNLSELLGRSGVLVSFFTSSFEERITHKARRLQQSANICASIHVRFEVEEVMLRCKLGEPVWLTPAVSFSTMMRFFQREKGVFFWRLERGETFIRAI